MAKKKPDATQPGASDLAARIKDAYATDGKALLLGAAMKDGAVLADARVQIPLAMMNRHGLIAGATGTLLDEKGTPTPSCGRAWRHPRRRSAMSVARR